MNRPSAFTTPFVTLALFSLLWLSSLAPALAAAVTDTFQLKLTGTERCRNNPKFVETIKVKATEDVTLTVTRDVLNTGDLTDIQATINTHGDEATIDAMTLNGRALPANKSGSTAQLVLSGRDPGNSDHFFTIKGTATFDKTGKLTKVTGTYVYQVLSESGGVPNIDCFGSGTVVTGNSIGDDVGSTSVRYHFFYSSGGPLMAVDPAAPAATPATVAPVVANAISVYGGTWNAATTSFDSKQQEFEVFASAGKLWKVKVATSRGVPGSASNPPVQISSESAATKVCAFSEVNSVSLDPNTRRLFYELPGADGECGLFFGAVGTNADNITKSVLISDGVAIAPTVLPTGLSCPTSRVFNLSNGIATHMFLIDAANSDTVKIIDLSTLSTQAITPTQANISSIFSVVQDTSNRVFLSSSSFDPNTFTFTSTLSVYTVSSNTVVPLVAGASFASGENSDGTNLFVANTTEGILYRVPLTATGAGQVTPIFDNGGQIYSFGVTTNRVFVVVPVGITQAKIISVPKSGGAVREDVPAAEGSILPIAAANRFYYTRFVLSSTATVISSTTVALREDGTTLKSFANAGLTGVRFSGPLNVRGPIGVVTEVLVSTYVSGVLNGGTMTTVAAATGVATPIVGTIPSTVPSLGQLFFSWTSVDNAALALGFLSFVSPSANRAVFFMDSATANSLVQVPVALGLWQVVP